MRNDYNKVEEIVNAVKNNLTVEEAMILRKRLIEEGITNIFNCSCKNV